MGLNRDMRLCREEGSTQVIENARYANSICLIILVKMIS